MSNETQKPSLADLDTPQGPSDKDRFWPQERGSYALLHAAFVWLHLAMFHTITQLVAALDLSGLRLVAAPVVLLLLWKGLRHGWLVMRLTGVSRPERRGTPSLWSFWGEHERPPRHPGSPAS